MNTPSHMPLPGQHLPGVREQAERVDPGRIRADVEELLAGLSGDEAGPPTVGQRARILEEAHEVLVRALGSVDKI